MRVAYLSEFPTRSGGEAMLLELLGRLDRARVEPLVVCPGGGALARALAERAIAHRPFDFKAAGGSFEARADALARALAAEDVDLVHANTVALAAISGHLARAHGRAAVAHARDIGRMSAARAAAVSENRAVVCVSEAVRRSLLEAGVAADRLRLIADGVDAARLDPARVAPGALRAELGLASGERAVVLAGMISLRKAQDVLLAAAPAVLARHPGARFVLIGDRPSDKAEVVAFERDLRARAEAPPLRGRVHWLGWRPDAPALLRDADVVVNAARQEPLGVVVLEAMALARPIVATAVGGTPEQIEDGASGRLVPPDDPAALAAAVSAMLDDPAAAARMGEAARAAARARFDPAAAAAAVMALYDEVTAAS